ncbi:sodium:calcium antiporter [Parabacteroides sp. 52]|uniref:calcium/sodium antiporter n=1 Tax=unclassified Parabacteroides TaxID=2649774 RepID=UPI0013D17DBA|nr:MULTISPECIES: calcium/sodium antiporter [unclassified Parabacteroides]MDH6534083.1 cation:H+ antiporter [Parabacteroides sp. PM5-20]NDV55013.1 sodium:calcium antiporter [Parabacteroides sp. 52]
MHIIFLIGGLLLILWGANALTDGAAAVAKRFRISDLVIGLTIVAFGTSAPELTVSVVSALKGSADLAVGNVLGSNLFNTLMIVGCTAAILPIKITQGTLKHEIPLTLLASVAFFICASDILINRAEADVISRSDGLLLLCFFAIFLGYTFAIARKETAKKEEDSSVKAMPHGKAALFIIGGLAGLIYGGQLFVDGASGIARSLGVSESIIALTLVAGGTSLPELATSVVAALKKKPEIAIGNVIGSNLFNIFFVLGCSATITPLNLQGIQVIDFYALIGSSILLYLFGMFFKKRTITRLEGIILIAGYIAYTLYLIYS